jgi:hypothetical protein
MQYRSSSRFVVTIPERTSSHRQSRPARRAGNQKAIALGKVLAAASANTVGIGVSDARDVTVMGWLLTVQIGGCRQVVQPRCATVASGSGQAKGAVSELRMGVWWATLDSNQ